MQIIALFGPTGVGKTEVAVALAERLDGLGARSARSRSRPTRCRCTRDSRRSQGWPRRPSRRKLEHRLVSFLPLDATFSVGQYAELAHAEIDAVLAAGRRPLVVGGTGLYLRAALTELDLRPPPPEGVREHWTAELERDGAPRLHALLGRRAAWAAQGIDPNDGRRVVRALELLDAGELEPPDGPSQLWSAELRRPTLLAGLTMEREALYARIDARVDAMLAAGAARGGAPRARGRSLADGAQGARLRGAAGGRRGGDEASHAQLRAPPAHLDAQARGGAHDRRHRPRRRRCGARDPRLRRLMRFEKWQALGNDYLIVEADELPFALTPARVRRLCEGHFGVFADGVLLLSRPEDSARTWRTCGSTTQTARRPSCRAMARARRSCTCAGAAGRSEDEFSIKTAAGTIRPRITGLDTCRVDMGRASLTSKDFPGGPADGRGELLVDGL